MKTYENFKSTNLNVAFLNAMHSTPDPAQVKKPRPSWGGPHQTVGSKTRVIMTEESSFIRVDGAAPVSGRTHSSLIDTGVVKSANWNHGKAARS